MSNTNQEEQVEQITDELDISVDKTWKNSNGEGVDYHARHTVRDPETNLEISVNEQNIFDAGYVVSVWESKLDREEDEWVNDVICKVTNVEDNDVDAIQQKFTVKLFGRVFEDEIDNDEYMDVTIWNSTDVDTNVEEGDLVHLDSLVVNTFNDDTYLSFNKASTLQTTTEQYITELTEQIKSNITENGAVDTEIRL